MYPIINSTAEYFNKIILFFCRHYAALKTMEQLETVYIPR